MFDTWSALKKGVNYMSLKALMFDCDGVIAETEADGHRVAFNKVFEQEGIDAFWGEEEYGPLCEVGGGKERMTAFFRSDPVKYPPDIFNEKYVAKLHKDKTAIFSAMAKLLPSRPGVARLMREAVDAGVFVMVCSTSNEKSVGAIVGALLGEDKDKIVSRIFAGDVVKAKKPEPDIYKLAAESFGLLPEECLVIEDTRIGLLAAIGAGMRCLVTKSRYSRDEDFTGAVAVADSLESVSLRDLEAQFFTPTSLV